MLKKHLEHEGEVVVYQIMWFSSHKSMIKAIFPGIVGFEPFSKKIEDYLHFTFT
jgi:hypothetical protein